MFFNNETEGEKDFNTFVKVWHQAVYILSFENVS